TIAKRLFHHGSRVYAVSYPLVVLLLALPAGLHAQTAPIDSMVNKDSLDAVYDAMMAYRVLPFVAAARGVPADPGASTSARTLGISKGLLEKTQAEFQAKLTSAAARAPGDHWMLGQRVRAFVNAGNFLGADTTLRNCRSEPWWCSILT